MALRALRASTSNLSRQPWRSLSTSLPRHNQAVLPDEFDVPETDDVGPPTSSLYPSPAGPNNGNPLRRDLLDGLPDTDERGLPIKNGCWSGGSCGFKGAGYQCAVRAFARVKTLAQEVPGARFEFRFRGFGQGRDAVFKALMTSEGDEVRPFVNCVTDNTPIKIGGTRAKKTRRL
ncbi:hypothetical protein EI94DRAFT_1728186 [Lactarius quietus]|nr:hypothetical protein EI94DRAFT_1728186 [Lactarius quietus]